jgi:hypothetical protein
VSEFLQAIAALVWIFACLAGAVYCAVIGEIGITIGLVCASLALPIALPVMHE